MGHITFEPEIGTRAAVEALLALREAGFAYDEKKTVFKDNTGAVTAQGGTVTELGNPQRGAVASQNVLPNITGSVGPDFRLMINGIRAEDEWYTIANSGAGPGITWNHVLAGFTLEVGMQYEYRHGGAGAVSASIYTIIPAAALAAVAAAEAAGTVVSRDATTSLKGTARLATAAEASAGTGPGLITPALLKHLPTFPTPVMDMVLFTEMALGTETRLDATLNEGKFHTFFTPSAPGGIDGSSTATFRNSASTLPFPGSYHNGSALTPDTGDWTGSTGSFTIGAGTLSAAAAAVAIRSTRVVQKSIMNLTATLASAPAGSGDWLSVGFIDAADLGAFNSTNGKGGMAAIASSRYITISNTGAVSVRSGGTQVHTTTISNADVISFVGMPSGIQFRINGGAQFTFPYTNGATGTAHMVVAKENNGGAAADLSAITFQVSEARILLSSALTALAAPAKVRVGMVVSGVPAAFNPATDLVVEASRDNGVTFSNVTPLRALRLNDNSVLVVGTATVSGQPSGTQVRWKITGVINVPLVLRSVASAWA